jgi:hypothetical protein
VNEEDTITTEKKPIEAGLNKKDMENGSSEPSVRPSSAASYKGKRDPFTNEGGGDVNIRQWLGGT